MQAKRVKHLRLETFLNLTRADAWDLLWQPEGQSQWLGPDSRLVLRENARVIFCDGSGSWREAQLDTLTDLTEVRFQVSVPLDWHVWVEKTNLKISLADAIRADGSPGCVVTFEEGPIPGHCFNEVERYWSQRKQCLRAMDKQIQKRRKSPRQAIVLIHGIGEQRPGEILNSFLTSGVLGNKKWGTWVKPDQLSDLLELRKATLNGNQIRPTTDVYEVYWAHLIRDTTLGQVAGWLRRLLFRLPLLITMRKVNGRRRPRARWTVPLPLTPLWVLAWFMLLSLAAIGLGKLLNHPLPAWIPPWAVLMVGLPLAVPIVGALFQYFGKDFVTNYLGDAARYLQPHPANVNHRQAIRSHGVSLLEKLHHMGTYDRIVVVGHSLGSVIAYDILAHAWAKLHRAHRRPTTRRRAHGDGPFQSLRRVEKAASEKLIGLREAQKLQHEAWRDLRINTLPWLVTDLVTLGSPLTYADFLLADGVNTTHKLKRNRSLPISPPWMEKVRPFGERRRRRSNPCPEFRFSYETEYSTAVGEKKHTFTLYDHAALFAVTRWTNLYVPSGLLGLSGDAISGPLGKEAGGLGKWILDVRLDRHPLKLMHTWYWNTRTGIFPAWRRHGNLGVIKFLRAWLFNRKQLEDDSRIRELEIALNLNVREELRDLLQQIPAYTLLD